MKTISSQRYRDEEIVQAKRDAKDYEVFVSPAFEVEGETFRAILDGHHSLEAARLDGVEPEYIEQTERESDRIALLAKGAIEDFLTLSYIDAAWYDIATDIEIW